MRAALAVFGLLASVQPLTPQRGWLERFALVVPGPQATRWLLVADVACLVGLGLSLSLLMLTRKKRSGCKSSVQENDNI